MFLTFLVALFWAGAILYMIGLGMGIFSFKASDTQIAYMDDTEQNDEEQQEQQLEKKYEEPSRVNMNSMF